MLSIPFFEIIFKHNSNERESIYKTIQSKCMYRFAILKSIQQNYKKNDANQKLVWKLRRSHGITLVP